jgi:hypothetical protein
MAPNLVTKNFKTELGVFLVGLFIHRLDAKKYVNPEEKPDKNVRTGYSQSCSVICTMCFINICIWNALYCISMPLCYYQLSVQYIQQYCYVYVCKIPDLVPAENAANPFSKNHISQASYSTAHAGFAKYERNL